MSQASDILILGGGIIGLSLAVELKLRGASVAVLSRDFQEAAALAAAGMLAPQAEAIPPGPLLDLCLQSRNLYPDWIQKIESISGLETGYWNCGILAPVYEKNSEDLSAEFWLDEVAIHQFQTNLSSEVVGGWWYPEDGQVDNRALYRSTLAAVRELKIPIYEGVAGEILHQNQQVSGIKTTFGTLQAGHYIIATGAWSQDLLPIPVYPKKGQMLSVSVPETLPDLPLQTVLFGTESYIVPRKNRQIIIGATSELVGFTPGNTPSGIKALLTAAIRLFPALNTYPIQEFWWGYRPTTPDELPILGSSPWQNLTLATGHYRNGILLAPRTAMLIADWLEQKVSQSQIMPFHYTRFQNSL